MALLPSNRYSTFDQLHVHAPLLDSGEAEIKGVFLFHAIIGGRLQIFGQSLSQNGLYPFRELFFGKGDWSLYHLADSFSRSVSTMTMSSFCIASSPVRKS